MGNSDLELVYAPAYRLLELFKVQEISPVDVLEAQISRIEAENEKVNAITYTHFDSARKAAKESEKRYKQGNPRPLEGITVGMKDEHGMAGWIVTQGSKLYKDAKLEATDPVTDKLLEAGAILHIQTTVPEFCFSGVTWTDLWGVTRNPWNLKYAVGGSSGGSGAALAAGFCTLATGSDMGGSIRIPCAFNGLYGYKPPYGRVPTTEILLVIASNGPMARTLPDIIHMQNTISGPHPYSPSTIRPKLELPLEYSDLKGVRIAFSPDQSWAQIDTDTAKNTAKAVDLLRQAGAVVDEVDLDLGVTADDLRFALVEAALYGPQGATLGRFASQRDQMTTYGKDFVDKAATGGYGAKEALQYENNIKAANNHLQSKIFLKGYDAMVMPTLATSHIPADLDYTQDTTVINGVEVNSLAGWILTPLFNILNWYPVINAPTGRSSEGMPTGLQIVAQSYDDLTAHRIAAGYSEVAPQLFTGNQFPDFRGGN